MNDKLAPVPVFISRILEALLMALGLIGVALLLGIAGYHWIAGFGWLDSLLEASMILGGMGPVRDLPKDEAAPKIFVSVYALFSGLVFIGVMGFVLSPVAHRVLHKFHLDDDDMKKTGRKKR
jgi:hypothetical protein